MRKNFSRVYLVLVVALITPSFAFSQTSSDACANLLKADTRIDNTTKSAEARVERQLDILKRKFYRVLRRNEDLKDRNHKRPAAAACPAKIEYQPNIPQCLSAQ
ncbi:MAG: hypothetical protein RL417_1163 [Pseudomonadota bacterium]